MFQKTQKLSPNDGNVFYALGSVYNAQGNYSDAVTALQQSIQLKPNFPSANYQLGVAYNGLGYTDGVQEQQKILNGTDSNLAKQLSDITNPKITGIDNSNIGNTFNTVFGPNTSLLIIDPSFIKPNSTKVVSTVIKFDSNMDASSVTNASNWTISKGNNPQSGFYNNTMPSSSKDAAIPSAPISVAYNSVTKEATVSFRLKQNSTGDAVIDPNHLVFTFKGKDSAGQNIDPNANSIDGNATAAFGSVNTFA